MHDLFRHGALFTLVPARCFRWDYQSQYLPSPSSHNHTKFMNSICAYHPAEHSQVQKSSNWMTSEQRQTAIHHHSDQVNRYGHESFCSLLYHPYSTVTLVVPPYLSLPLCLEWYNGSKTPRVHSGVTKRTECRLGLHYRSSATVWMNVLNRCLECVSSFNTHSSHSRQWFNIHISTFTIYYYYSVSAQKLIYILRPGRGTYTAGTVHSVDFPCHFWWSDVVKLISQILN